MTPHHKDILKVWFAAGLWLVVIAIESTTYLSSDYTGRFLYPIFHFLFGMGWRQFAVWHHYIRKGGHFVGYFILSVLLFRAWKITLRLPSLWALRWSAIAFFMSALVASMDEWHQTYLPSRTGAISDVLLDSSAALTAQIVIFLFLRSKSARMAEEVPVTVRG
ncbi:MAG TPA: VanZ family protein [Terriglobales bacterium]|nr:VanZ family protein [Terriglobales bacterium]